MSARPPAASRARSAVRDVDAQQLVPAGVPDAGPSPSWSRASSAIGRSAAWDWARQTYSDLIFHSPSPMQEERRVSKQPSPWPARSRSSPAARAASAAPRSSCSRATAPRWRSAGATRRPARRRRRSSRAAPRRVPGRGRRASRLTWWRSSTPARALRAAHDPRQQRRRQRELRRDRDDRGASGTASSRSTSRRPGCRQARAAAHAQRAAEARSSTSPRCTASSRSRDSSPTGRPSPGCVGPHPQPRARLRPARHPRQLRRARASSARGWCRRASTATTTARPPRRRWSRGVALGRIGEPDEVARVIRFLASDGGELRDRRLAARRRRPDRAAGWVGRPARPQSPTR